MFLQYSYPFYILAVLAVIMGISTSLILKYAIRSKDHLQKLFSYILLAMMNSMLGAPAIYYSGIIHVTVTDVFLLSAGIMAAESVYPLIIFIQGIENGKMKEINWKVFVFFTIFDEYLMSLDFNSILSTHSILSQYGNAYLNLILVPLASIWFILPMSLEMILTTVLILGRRDADGVAFITIQSIVMLFTPTALNSNLWILISVYTGGAVMTALLVFVFHYMYRKGYAEKKFGIYINRIVAVYCIMMAGVLIFQYYGNVMLVSASILLEMMIYLHYMFRYESGGKKEKIYWLVNRKWTTLFLLNVFIAEVGMGATFDFQYFGAIGFISGLPFVPLSMSVYSIPSALFDSIIFVAGITGSQWFLIMMGIEMGAMVIVKMLKTKEIGNRIRLSLMLMAYAIYTIFLPYFVFTSSLPSYPFFGWSMGIGTAGGLSAALIVPMLLTYVISGSLSVLFGARQLCSVFCTAPVMYQGAFYGDMKIYNRSSPTGKKISLNGEKETKIYRVVSISVYLSLAITSLISILDSYFNFNLYLFGIDPLAFTYVILFDIMWYAVFVTMPYFGSYGCINTGYCHWGNFNRWIARFGFFRLKVKSTDMCVTCESKACATACPVGNSSHPGSFISSGEWKGNRCVGIGECLEACPYDNIFFYDVRNYMKERLRAGKRQ